jgi:hypothetical protein
VLKKQFHAKIVVIYENLVFKKYFDSLINIRIFINLIMNFNNFLNLKASSIL